MGSLPTDFADADSDGIFTEFLPVALTVFQHCCRVFAEG
jgi:hypothetical protein